MTPLPNERTRSGGAGSRDDWGVGAPGHSSPIRFSRGYGPNDATPAQHEAPTVDDFIDYILADRGERKGEQWISAPCRVAPPDDKHRGNPSMAKAIGRHHRCRDCALPRAFVGLDADSLTPEQTVVVMECLRRYRGVAYTTASSTPQAPRLRGVVVLHQELTRDELIRASAAIRAQIDAELGRHGLPPVGWDASCDRPEQPLYLPLHDAWVVRLEGPPVDARELVGLTPPLGSPAMEPRPSAADRQPSSTVLADPYALAALHRATEAIIAAAPGNRNEVLNREAYSIGGLVGDSRIDRHVAETLLVEATRKAGWDDDAKNCATVRGSLATGMAEPRRDGLSDAINMVLGVEPGQPCGLTLVDLRGLRTATLTPTSFVLEPIIPCGTVTLFGGHGGSGKSLVALTWAAHVACGRDWASLPCSGPQKCMFVSLEDPGSVVLPRLRAIADTYGLDFDLIEQNLIVLDGADIEAALVVEVNEFGSRRVRETARLRELTELAQGCGFIVVDNASDAFDGDENNRRQVREFIRLLAQLARKNDAGLVLLAHIDKNAAIHGAKGNSYSGSTAWHNSARSRLAIEGGNLKVILRHEKANLSALAKPVVLVWHKSSDCSVLVPVDPAADAAAMANESIQDTEAILQLLCTAADAGIEVPAATRGSSTAVHALAMLREFPRTYNDKQGRLRVAQAIVQLKRDGLIEQVAVKSSSRNTKDVLKLTRTGEELIRRSRASIPHTPSVTDARAEADASDTVATEANATHATHESHAAGFKFIREAVQPASTG